MRVTLLALIAVALAAVPFARPPAVLAASVSAPAYAGIVAVDDAEDVIPSLGQMSAALAALGAPPISELDVLPSQPLADRFDEGSRFVMAPSGNVGQVTITVGSWIVDDDHDEHADFQSALTALRSSSGSPVTGDLTPVDPATAYGANEAYDVVFVAADPGKPQMVTAYRLARFSKAIALTSAEVQANGAEIKTDDGILAGQLLALIAKVVADNALAY